MSALAVAIPAPSANTMTVLKAKMLTRGVRKLSPAPCQTKHTRIACRTLVFMEPNPSMSNVVIGSRKDGADFRSGRGGVVCASCHDECGWTRLLNRVKPCL